MKTIKMMTLVAAATLLMAACGKDKVAAGDNQAVVDGTVYELESHVSHASNGFYYVDAAGTQGNRFGFRFDCGESCVGKSIDLSKAVAGVDYGFGISYGENEYDAVSQDCHEGSVYGSLGEDNVDHAVYKEGTMSVTNDSKSFVVSLDGTTTSGIEMSIRVVVPSDQVEELDW